MAATINLGRDYTVSGLNGISDLEVSYSSDRIDVTTREGSKPIKKTVAGLSNTTFTCTVLATSNTKFTIGKKYPVTLAGGTPLDFVCMDATREEPQEGVINYKLTLKPGDESDGKNQIDIGAGNYRTT